MSLLRLRAGYFLSGIGLGAGIALLQLRADLAASTELLSTQVRGERVFFRFLTFVFFQFGRACSIAFCSFALRSVCSPRLVPCFPACPTGAGGNSNTEREGRARKQGGRERKTPLLSFPPLAAADAPLSLSQSHGVGFFFFGFPPSLSLFFPPPPRPCAPLSPPRGLGRVGPLGSRVNRGDKQGPEEPASGEQKVEPFSFFLPPFLRSAPSLFRRRRRSSSTALLFFASSSLSLLFSVRSLHWRQRTKLSAPLPRERRRGNEATKERASE